MPKAYNEIAGRSVERLAALSDGLFAIAMTLLIIDLHARVAQAIHSEAELWQALGRLAPQLVMYLMGFLTLGIFWVGQQTQLNVFAETDRDLTWIHIGFLAAVALMPFSTAIAAAFITYRVAIFVYWLNLLLPGLALYASWAYAARAGLLKDQVAEDMSRATRPRIVVFQLLYAVGFLLSFVSTYLAHRFHLSPPARFRDCPASWKTLANLTGALRAAHFACSDEVRSLLSRAKAAGRPAGT